jgi:hypothetical protein
LAHDISRRGILLLFDRAAQKPFLAGIDAKIPRKDNMNSWLLFAQQNDDAAGGAAVSIVLLIELAILVVVVIGLWKVFQKAGKPGWASIIPIYNVIVLLEIIGKPIWWIVLFFIPCVNFIVGILVALEVAKSFGKSAGFGVGLAFLPFVFYPILGFGDARYIGPAAPAV